jgi:putative ABC transport system permease protein
VREPTGTIKDAMVFLNIDTARRLYGLLEKDPQTGRPARDAQGRAVTQKRVNVIEAESVAAPGLTPSEIVDRLAKALRSAEVEVEVHALHGIAEGRRRALASRSRKLNALSVGVFVFGALAVSGYAVLNVRKRRREIGIMLAVAARPGRVAWMFLEKMLVLGLLGGVVGCIAGEAAAARWGPPGTAGAGTASWQTYLLALSVALAVTILPGLAGVFIVSRVDPAETLRDL